MTLDPVSIARLTRLLGCWVPVGYGNVMKLHLTLSVELNCPGFYNFDGETLSLWGLWCSDDGKCSRCFSTLLGG